MEARLSEQRLGSIAVLQVAEIRRANWARRLRIQKSGERIFWQNMQRLKETCFVGDAPRLLTPRFRM
jgi:hypothetical protein